MIQTTHATREQADQVLESIKKQYAAYVAAGDVDLRVIENWDSSGTPVVAWESGAPYEWTLEALVEHVDEELYALALDAGASRDRARRTATVVGGTLPAGLYVEPYDAYTLCVYPDA